MWQTGNVRLPKQCAGRRLGHGYQGNCSPLSDKERALYFKTSRMRRYGSQNWPSTGIEGKVLLVDCITYGCTAPSPPPPPFSTSDTFTGTCSIGGIQGECLCYDANQYLVGSKFEGVFDGERGCHVPSLSGTGVTSPDPFGKTSGGEKCPTDGSGNLIGRRMAHNAAATDCSGCSGQCASASVYKDTMSGTCSLGGVAGTCECTDVHGYLVGSKFEGLFEGKMSCAVTDLSGGLSPDPFGKTAGSELCPTTGGSGRRLGHNVAVTDCTGCSGQCAPAPYYKSVPVGRRNLAHGSASATVPQGWQPDASLPFVTGANEPGSGFCDITSMVRPSSVQSAPTIAAITYTWVIVCSFVPRTNIAFTQFSDLGFVGLLVLFPCTTRGCGPDVFLAQSATLFDSNPVPSLPIIVASQGNDVVQVTAAKLGKYPESRDDEFSFSYEMLQAISDNVAGSPGPWPTTLYVNCTDDGSKFYDTANSPGYRFLYVLYGISHVFLIGISIVVLLRKCKGKQICSWATYVLCVEGIFSTMFRGWRCFTGQYFWNGHVGTTIDTGNYFGDSAEAPLSLGTTWVAVVVWAKVVLNLVLTKKTGFIYNFIIWCGIIFLTVYTQYYVLLFPFQPWWAPSNPDMYSGFANSDAIRDAGNNPIMYGNIVMTALFVLMALLAIIKIARAAKMSSSASIIRVMKRMFPLIIMQAVGLGFGIVAQIALVETASSPEAFSVAWGLVIPGHFKEIGGVLAGYGQVLALVASSSSSSSTAATPTTTPHPWKQRRVQG